MVQVRDAKASCEVGGGGEGGKGTILHVPGGRHPSAPVVPAGSSPHPSLTEEEDSQTELLIAEEKLSPEQEGQLMPR